MHSNSNSPCRHFCTGDSDDWDAFDAGETIDPDLEILRMNPSKKIGKKSTTRVQKCVASFVKKQGKGKEEHIYAAFLGLATHNLLTETSTKFVREKCLNALHFASMFSLLSESEIEGTTKQILTGGGLTSFLAKTIPCNCLTNQANVGISSSNQCLHGGGDMRAIKLIATVNDTRMKNNKALTNTALNYFPGVPQDERYAILVAECFSLAAQCLLEEAKWSRYEAHDYCKIAGVLGLDAATMTGSESLELLQQLSTESGLILHVGKQIPCSCLASKKKAAKRAPKTGYCLECRKSIPNSELFQCSRCKVACYCSESCQLTHWKYHHKRDCRRYAQQQRKEAEKTKETEEEEEEEEAKTLKPKEDKERGEA